MLKGAYRLWLSAIALLLIIGILLCGIGFAMDQDLSCIQEEKYHKWYQIIYRDDEGNLNIGLNFDDAFSIGHVKIALENGKDQ